MNKGKAPFNFGHRERAAARHLATLNPGDIGYCARCRRKVKQGSGWWLDDSFPGGSKLKHAKDDPKCVPLKRDEIDDDD